MERWEFLSSWWQQLKWVQYHGLYGVENVWHAHERRLVLAISRWHYSFDYDQDMESFPQYLQKVRESLALLAAVAHVDYPAWKHLLVKYSKVNFVKEEDEMLQDEVAVRFVLQLDWAKKSNIKFEEPMDYDLVLFCGVQQRTQPSPEYLSALSQIAAMDTALRPGRPGIDLRIPVRVHFTPKTEENPVKKLYDVVSAEKTIQQQWGEYDSAGEEDVAPGSLRCTFVLEPMVLDLNYFEISPDFAAAFETLMLENARFSKVTDLAVKRSKRNMSSESVSVRSFGRFMVRLFDSTRRLPDLASTKYHPQSRAQRLESTSLQVGSVALKCHANALETRDFAAMCSAMAVNKTTRDLSIQLRTNLATSAAWWQWLAYAMFSPRARASSVLESLTLTSITSLSVADMTAFAAMLAAKHPEEELFSCSHGQVTARDATLTANAPIRLQLADSDASNVVNIPMTLHGLRTFSDDGASEWVNVLVPGLGHCLVQRHALTFDELPTTQATTGVTALTIEFDAYQSFNSSGLPRLLEAVGPYLKSLTLSGPRMRLDENKILKSCPKLEKLSLCGGLVDVQLDFTGYVGSRVLPTCHWHNVAAMAHDLSDPSSPLTKCVRRLRVRLTDQWDGWGTASGGYESAGFDSDLKPLLDMLQVNQSLELFELNVRPQYQIYRDEFKRYDLQPINRASRLSMEMKLAFLSVLLSRKPSRACSEIPPWQLNQDVLYNIFAFASPPVLRHVYFHKKRSGWGWLDEREN